jgi:hypothetical protein
MVWPRGHEEVVVMTVVTQPKPTGAPEPSFVPAASEAAVELYWLPSGRVAGSSS